MIKKILGSLFIIACCPLLHAAEPAGYYSKCEGLYGAQLLAQLENVVGNHTNVGYSGLWTLYQKSDVYPDGTIWDIYSTKHFTYKSEQCGTYKNVGDCYNREHSMPKSWFNEASPMYSDAFHIYPTDGKVNGQRSNYPYGECANGTTLAGSGNVKALGRLGKSTFSGYSGTVFEPDDEYKGDIARSYFYMAAAYNSKVKGWSTSSTNLGGTSYPVFNSWSEQMLLNWHRQDPVSQKELNRNEAIYAAQGNRNPFIDHPELAEHIWGDKKSQGWSGKTVEPELTLPAEGTIIDFGETMAGVSRTATMVVKGSNLSGTVNISLTGSVFSVSAVGIPAVSACTTSGYTVTITFSPTASGAFNETLTVSCDNLTRKVTLKGSAISNLPAGPVTSIGETSFEAVWSYVGDSYNGYYLLDVEGVRGYPKLVDATAERYVVDNLEPATEYTYTVSSTNMKSNPVTVRTLDATPYVAVLYDGELVFTSVAGKPSEIAELIIETDNVDSDITLAVGSPFELSDDKALWSKRITIDPEQERVYLRMNANEPGTYTSSLIITVNGYRFDDVNFSGTVYDDPDGLKPGVMADYHRWDAFCRGGRLLVEAKDNVDVRIYALDATEVYIGTVYEGITSFDVAPGLYIVAVDDFARRVLVK